MKKMEYKIVEIDEKIIVGLSERMKNDNTTIEKIKNLWKNFCNEDGIGEIKNIRDRINKNTVSVYYNYSNENELEYNNLIGCEVENKNTYISNNLTRIIIPSGKYAKFTIYGNPNIEVTKFWNEFWGSFGNDLDRLFSYDFEEYIQGNDNNNMEINIYIGIK